MELTFIRPDNWATAYPYITCQVNDNEPTVLVGGPTTDENAVTVQPSDWTSPTEYTVELPNDVYLAIATSGSTDTVTLRIKGLETTTNNTPSILYVVTPQEWGTNISATFTDTDGVTREAPLHQESTEYSGNTETYYTIDLGSLDYGQYIASVVITDGTHLSDSFNIAEHVLHSRIYIDLTAEEDQLQQPTMNDTLERNLTLQLLYSVSHHSTINISDLILNNATSVIVGEADTAPETVFVSKSNLATVWGAVVSNVKNYTHSKNYVDNKFANVYDKSSTYSATQINTLLTNKADKSSTYTKTEVDNLISSNNNVYTKAEVDALLANAGGDTSNFYTKAEIDEMLGDIESGSY